MPILTLKPFPAYRIEDHQIDNSIGIEHRCGINFQKMFETFKYNLQC